MKIGYARVSTKDQSLEDQVKDLYAAGCEKVFQETISSVTTIKPELEKALQGMGADDRNTRAAADRRRPVRVRSRGRK